MSYNYVINIGYGLHEVKDGKMQPSAVSGGKALFIINGDSIIECEQKLQDFIKNNKITKLKEWDDGNRNSWSDEQQV